MMISPGVQISIAGGVAEMDWAIAWSPFFLSLFLYLFKVVKCVHVPVTVQRNGQFKISYV